MKMYSGVKNVNVCSMKYSVAPVIYSITAVSAAQLFCQVTNVAGNTLGWHPQSNQAFSPLSLAKSHSYSKCVYTWI